MAAWYPDGAGRRRGRTVAAVGRFMLQRILHGIATLAGVVVLVFGLFHLVGGGAARFALDELAPATERAAYDARRGFDRPLVMGRWQRDGSLGDTSFDRDAGLWRADPRVLYRRALGPLPGRIGLPPGAPPYRVPLAEPLDPGRSYQLMVTYRTADESKAVCRVTSVDDPGTAIAESPMPPTRGWQVVTLPLDPLPGGGARSAWIEVRDADIEVATLSLDRRLNSPFDGQFAHFAGRVAHMDLGVSQRTGQPVRELSTQLAQMPSQYLMLVVATALVGPGCELVAWVVCVADNRIAFGRGNRSGTADNPNGHRQLVGALWYGTGTCMECDQRLPLQPSA